jgi:hypothetical protein
MVNCQLVDHSDGKKTIATTKVTMVFDEAELR